MYILAALLLVVMAVDTGRDLIQPVDDAWRDLMVRLDWGPSTAIANALDFLGSVWITLPLRIGVAIWLATRTRWAALTVWVSVWLISDLSIGLFKNGYERARPLDALVETTGFSFPSGHAVAGAATAVALVIVLLRPGPHRRIWELRAAGFALVMALSRTYLRAHWLSDVVAGALLGAATALAVAAVVHWWRVQRFRRGLGPMPRTDEVDVDGR
jgi:undecaprenyl-diphosphatase